VRFRFLPRVAIQIIGVAAIGFALFTSHRSFAAEQTTGLPAWLMTHIGDSDGQISALVLRRARALYEQKRREGVVRNPCYFAMDATRPNDLPDGSLGRRFYVICESQHAFRAISAGHGGGRALPGIADFTNGKQCAKNFSNAMGSALTAGGAYVTAETTTSFKGDYPVSAGQDAALIRSFVQFDGEGETADARQRAIGGHAALSLNKVCRRKDPTNAYANQQGYIPIGTLVDYAGGRSEGCTSWLPSDAPQVIALVKHDPTTLYIYPEAGDIDAVARAVAAQQPLERLGLYWDASCLKEIGSPEFWPRQTLEPILATYKRGHPAPAPRPLPICTSP